MSAALDAHVHLWDRASTPQPWIDPATMPAIDRDFGPAELEAVLGATGFSAAVLVQSTNSTDETRQLLSLAASTRVAAVVGWVDLTRDVAAQVDALRAAPGGGLLRGVRHLAHLEQDPAWLLRDDVGRGLDALAEAGLVFDLVVRAHQLPLAVRVARAHPRTRFVLDHLGNPVLDALGPWLEDLVRLAGEPNVVAKLSGLIAFAPPPWSRATVEPAMTAALDAFGPERLLYGSDWPLAELAAGGAVAWAQEVRAFTGRLSATERDAVLGGTGASTYGVAA